MRRTKIFCFLACFPLVFAACGGGDDTTPGAAGSGGAGGATAASTTTTTAASAGGAGGESGEGGAEPVPEMTNNPDACTVHAVGPGATEFGDWAADRLTPPSYPFEVTGIRYVLNGEAAIGCDSGIGHRVRVFVGADTVPPVTPEDVQTLTVPATAGEEGPIVKMRDLSPHILLTAGQHLFIAVEMVGNASAILCVGACSGPQVEADRNYWSTESEAPYDWKELASSSLEWNYRFDAYGHSP